MSTVIIDIETVSIEGIESSDLVKSLLKNKTPEEAVAELGKLALYPLTGKVVCVGMHNPDTGNTRTFYEAEEIAERKMLTFVWAAILPFKRVVTFNGRGFDLPFLMTRSAILGVPISRHDLMGNRYSSWPHCDLMDQLSFYGATRKFSLDTYCRAFGIESSKQDGVDGSKVGELYAAGEHQKIADYCAADCVATARLFDIWQKRMCK